MFYYQAYQAHSDIMIPVRNWAGTALRALGQPLTGIANNAVLRNLTAAYELIARAGLTHARPAFGIDGVTVGNREMAVHEHAHASGSGLGLAIAHSIAVRHGGSLDLVDDAADGAHFALSLPPAATVHVGSATSR